MKATEFYLFNANMIWFCCFVLFQKDCFHQLISNKWKNEEISINKVKIEWNEIITQKCVVLSNDIRKTHICGNMIKCDCIAELRVIMETEIPMCKCGVPTKVTFVKMTHSCQRFNISLKLYYFVTGHSYKSDFYNCVYSVQFKHYARILLVL